MTCRLPISLLFALVEAKKAAAVLAVEPPSHSMSLAYFAIAFGVLARVRDQSRTRLAPGAAACGRDGAAHRRHESTCPRAAFRPRATHSVVTAVCRFATAPSARPCSSRGASARSRASAARARRVLAHEQLRPVDFDAEHVREREVADDAACDAAVAARVRSQFANGHPVVGLESCATRATRTRCSSASTTRSATGSSCCASSSRRARRPTAPFPDQLRLRRNSAAQQPAGRRRARRGRPRSPRVARALVVRARAQGRAQDSRRRSRPRRSIPG